jgi:hypothetical protein
MHALLFAGGLGEFLPLWPSLYPTRIGIWLAIPLGVAIAGLASAAPRLPHRAWVAAGLAWLAAFGVEGWRMSRAGPFGTFFYEAAKSGRAPVAALVANEAVGGAFWVATLCRDNAVLTADDLAAFAWIRDRTPPAAVFATNYGDGGNLITAVAHRKVLEPHYYWFFYADQYEAWRRSARIDYIFVGSEQSPAWLATYTYHAATLDRDPGVELMFRAGNARVYRVKT